MDLQRIDWDSVDLNYLAPDMGNWWADVKAVMKLPVLQNARGSLTS
jgi:hypothetical protein